MSHGKEVAFCILVSCCPVPLRFFQLKDFELKHLDWCFASSGKWLWTWIQELRAMVICQPVSKEGRVLYWGTFCLCWCGWVCLSSSWSAFLPLFFPLCLKQALPWIFSDPLGPFPHEALMCVPRAWLTRKFRWRQQGNEEKRAGLWTKGLWALRCCAYLSPSEC